MGNSKFDKTYINDTLINVVVAVSTIVFVAIAIVLVSLVIAVM